MSDSCCQKEFDIRAQQAKQRRTLIIALEINAATFVMMIVAALASGSSSLLSGLVGGGGSRHIPALSVDIHHAHTERLDASWSVPGPGCPSLGSAASKL